MPTFSNYVSVLFVSLVFICLIGVLGYLASADQVKQNWAQYRCNPAYWMYSDDVSADFNACVQSTQTGMMGTLMQPMTELTSSLVDTGSNLADNLSSMRQMMGTSRDNTVGSVNEIFGVMTNVVIEFQKQSISLQDMLGKMAGTMVAMLYILDGSIKTMLSVWNGPPGQMVRSISSCFHPDTPVSLAGGRTCPMKDLPLGAVLADGGRVFSVMKLANLERSPFYAIPFVNTSVSSATTAAIINTINTSVSTVQPTQVSTTVSTSVSTSVNTSVNTTTHQPKHLLVTGDHYIYSPVRGKFVQVRNSEMAQKTDLVADELACLITTNRRIPIGPHLFWDWEDDDLTMPTK
jgi:hypothetical protein